MHMRGKLPIRWPFFGPYQSCFLLVIADQCDSRPCQNNSICVGGKCECLPGYSGENCKEGTSVIIKRINK